MTDKIALCGRCGLELGTVGDVIPPCPNCINRAVEPVAEFASGAKRSSKVPPLWMMPVTVDLLEAERFAIGSNKYDIHNWKKCVSSGDVGFVRQFYNHLRVHLGRIPMGGEDRQYNIREHKTDPDSMLGDVAGMVWNARGLAYIALEAPELFLKAFYWDHRGERGE